MDDIIPLYSNDFGMAFQWRKSVLKDNSKVQVVFKDTGFFITRHELVYFSESIIDTIEKNYLEFQENIACDSCRKLLLNTPANQVSLALDRNELLLIKDLIEGTLFQLDLENYLDKICSGN